MADLKAKRIWFHWHWEKDKDGHITKVPHSANGGATGTTANWAHTWVTYDEALATKESHNASGLGFTIALQIIFFDLRFSLLGTKWETYLASNARRYPLVQNL